MNKYYTPKIEEFHVGLKYEEYLGSWIKFEYDGSQTLKKESFYDDYGCPYDSIEEDIETNSVRVKVGTEDITKCVETGIKIFDKVINYDTKGCYVCDFELYCWDKNDGYSDDRSEYARCHCLSGESCTIYDIRNDKFYVKYSRSDLGGMKL